MHRTITLILYMVFAIAIVASISGCEGYEISGPEKKTYTVCVEGHDALAHCTDLYFHDDGSVSFKWHGKQMLQEGQFTVKEENTI